MTIDDVRQAKADLEAAGLYPSLNAILARIGGSKRDVARYMQEIVWHASPLSQPVEYQGQTYFTSQYFHREYVQQKPQGGKYQRHPDFLRVLRTIPTYEELCALRAIVELTWEAVKPEVKQNLLYLKDLFEANGHKPIMLLNGMAQAALSHHLDDVMNKQLSVAINANAGHQARQDPEDISTFEQVYKALSVLPFLAKKIDQHDHKFVQHDQQFVQQGQEIGTVKAGQRDLTAYVGDMSAKREEDRTDINRIRYDVDGLFVSVQTLRRDFAATDRDGPVNKYTVYTYADDFVRTTVSAKMYEVWKYECARLERGERHRPKGMDFPQLHYTLETLAVAFKIAQNQLPLFP